MMEPVPLVDQGILIDGSKVPENISPVSLEGIELTRHRMYSPTSKVDVLYMLNGKVNVVKYRELESIQSFEELIGPYKKCVILYPHSESEDSGHWCTVFANSLTSDRAEFFDAYGFYIDDPLESFNRDTMHKMHKLEPKLLELILNSKYADNFHYNDTPYQSELLATDACGLWTVLRLKNAHLNEAEFRKIYFDLPVQRGYLPDLVVSEVILELFPELKLY